MRIGLVPPPEKVTRTGGKTKNEKTHRYGGPISGATQVAPLFYWRRLHCANGVLPGLFQGGLFRALAHAGDEIAGVDVDVLAGDAGSEIRAQEGGCVADLLNRDVTLQR